MSLVQITVKYFKVCKMEYGKTLLIPFCDNSNFSLNLHPKEEKFIHVYLVILKTLILRNSKEISAL
jgi:hypothetical protein